MSEEAKSTEPSNEEQKPEEAKNKVLDLRDGRVRVHHIVRAIKEVEEELGHTMTDEVMLRLISKLDPIMMGCYETGRAVENGMLEPLPGEAKPTKPSIIMPDKKILTRQ